MSEQQLPSDGTQEGDTPGERVTLSIPIHLAAPARRTVVREGPKPERPIGRIPLAQLTKLITARITQIMNLLVLAPDIQEEILFMPPVTKGPAGPAAVTERDLRPLVKTLLWSEQRERWATIQAVL